MRKLWDHTINMKKRFMPKKRKVYLLSREKREEVHEFISEQLRKGYIRPLKSPQMASVFFVGKKDRKKDIVENIGTKKVFTKIDLRWDYNNVWIKEGDEWKTAFTILERSFEPTVMFFRLTNLPVIFQTMMNELLWNIINTGMVVNFIDDVIIETEIEEGHNEIVEEVVK